MIRWLISLEDDRCILIQFESNHGNLQDCIESMHMLNSLVEYCTQLAKSIVDKIVVPLMHQPDLIALVEASDKYAECQFVSTHGSVVDERGDALKTTNTFTERLVLLLDVLEKHLLSRLLALDGKYNSFVVGVCTRACELIAEQFIPIVEPRSKQELDAFPAIRAVLTRLESSWMTKGYLEHAVLSDRLNQTQHVYVRNQSAQYLQMARTLLMADGFEEQVVHSDVAALPPALTEQLQQLEEKRILPTDIFGTSTTELFGFPKMSTSKRIHSLLERIESVLRDAVAMNSMDLVHTAVKMVHLYCALLPAKHAKLIYTIPFLSALFYNDCMYMAHRLVELGHLYRYQLVGLDCPPIGFLDVVPALHRLGHHALSMQSTTQQKNLLDYFVELDGFHDASHPARKQAIQRTLDQIDHTLHQLSKAIHTILPPHVFNILVGGWINTVYERCIYEVQSLIDISAQDSEDLHELCTSLYALADMLHKTSDIVVYVPVWSKYQYLVDMLQLSFADIMALFRQGDLESFALKELTNLICALFSDTALRTRNLDEIRKSRE